MPVSLDKTPAPLPEDMDSAPAYRVELRKLTALWFVIADDEGQWTRQDRGPARDVLHVERAADHDVERAMQRDDIRAELAAAPGHTLTEVYAVSAAHAAGLARREFYGAQAIEAAETITFGQFDA
ncbi:hypothetical protein [Streptomyces stelliscabiei]|uniref:hypothetical protein n=1 Tax=Streptomyces stelliscabiei TaxID=146820 RepID=UPI0029AE8FF2|nr:hypothetical protein [Streptomyces stelliscabiei]MDX2554719.1 hypothetical protein [Streptomyces stelliscabiei]MDX2613246.1 hypothetical protein [Streptomyces stelliscabiei]MDX2638478.1 hypothetical protein [Streptomyces stelliscabiei]MDX2661630.1 hypothetical protein [Streptomyces stelliscabiei]MDX2712237.1 hypothetical protein [Streptomyces stelliscabiei]